MHYRLLLLTSLVFFQVTTLVVGGFRFGFDCASKYNKADQHHRDETHVLSCWELPAGAKMGRRWPRLSSPSSWKAMLVLLLLAMIRRSVVTAELDFDTY